MARKPLPWFRLYVSAVRDTKLRRLPASQRWVWVAVLAAARESCQPGLLLVSERQPMTDRDIADMAAVSVSDVRKALAAFEAADMIDRSEANGGAWHVTNWDHRQYQSDNTTERTRKHRTKERSNGVPDPFSGTPNGSSEERSPSGTDPETETDPDTRPQPTHVGTRPDPGDGGGSDPPSSKPPADTNALLTEAAASLAWAETDRRHAAGEIANPDGYQRSRIAPIRRQHEPAWRRILDHQPAATAQQLIDAVTSPPPAPAADPTAGQRQALHDRAAVEHGTLRAILHEPPPDPAEVERVHDAIAGLRNGLRPGGAA